MLLLKLKKKIYIREKKRGSSEILFPNRFVSRAAQLQTALTEGKLQNIKQIK